MEKSELRILLFHGINWLFSDFLPFQWQFSSGYVSAYICLGDAPLRAVVFVFSADLAQRLIRDTLLL